MFRIPPPPRLDARVEADRPITPDLLAAASGQPIERVGPFLSTWLDCARAVAPAGLVVVFEQFVLGRPDPLLLEAVHHLRTVRRADHLGRFDDEEERWYQEHEDDPDALWEPPTLADRVLDAMRTGQESERLLDGVRFDRLVRTVARAEPGEWLPLILLTFPLHRLMAELADAIRIGGAVVVDARLPGERAEGFRWAA